ncbi:MAG: hypothetical protein OIF32_04170, partial [Campylobacterales bacterium]|nr:hypothetical protein [Campylobacterales bacterium]
FIGSGKLLPSKGKAKVGFIILIDQVSLKGNNINQLELPLTITSSKEEEKRSGFTKYEASINGSLLENKFLIKGKHLPDFKINSQVILSGSLARTWSKNQFKRRFYLLVDHNKEVKK